MDWNEFLNSLGEKAKDWIKNQNLDQGFGQGFGQGFDQGYGQDFDQGYGQNFDQGYDQNYLQNYGQNYPGMMGGQQGQIGSLAQQFYNQYNTSIQAIQIGDVNQAEMAFHGATNTIQILGNQLPPNEFRIYKVMHQQIETSFRVAKAVGLYNEERFEKAGAEVSAASEICDTALQSFNQLSMNMMSNYVQANMLPIIKNSFLFFKIQIEAYKKMIQSEIDKLNNRFTDELAMLKEVSGILKTADTTPFEPDNLNFAVNYKAGLSRWANTIDIKIENLIERRKKTSFLEPYDKKIFIVHGHDHEALDELDKLLRESFKLNPVILTRESDDGDTIIEKFERYARECAFAFVLVTPDDMVEKDGKKYFQGRPNVLFELGWFCGRFGRDRVRVLRQRDTKLPSDLNGLISINFQDSLQEVFKRIYSDLENSGLLEAQN